MGRPTKGALGALLGVGFMLAALTSASAAVEESGPQTFHGGLIISGASGGRKVVGSVIAASGVFNGVGRIVERPNRPGDSDNQTRDDLVFAQGSFHLLSTNHHFSVKVNRKTCVITFKVKTNRDHRRRNPSVRLGEWSLRRLSDRVRDGAPEARWQLRPAARTDR
jgi:hypothetical protein